MEHIWTMVLILAACLGTSFMLSGMEAGVFALNRLRIRQLAREGRPKAVTLLGYLDRSEDFLWTIFVGNTLANFVMMAVLVFILHDLLLRHPVVLLVALALCAFFLHAFCDLLPKQLFRKFPNRLCLALAQPFGLVHFVLRPLVGMMAWFAKGMLRWTGGRTFKGQVFGSRDELKHLMQESASAFSGEERTMISRVLELQNRSVGDVAIPFSRAVTVNTGTPLEDAIKLCRERCLSRLPVWQHGADGSRIVGIFSVRPVLYSETTTAGRTVKECLRPAIYIDESMRLEEALGRLQRGGQRMGIVLDRNGREIALICLQDILRFVFGEVSL